MGKSLREIERIVGISNGYLSQLESDSIKQPSPNHLRRLANAYELNYSTLMELAGYGAPQIGEADAPSTGGLVFGSPNDLTEEDLQKVRAYIRDLRDARRVRGKAADNGDE
jgi:HTH-type transcriptional regulator, competence development regulator